MKLLICISLALGSLPMLGGAESTTASIGKPSGSFFALLVPDAKASAQWYRDILGFHIVRDSTAPDHSSRTIMLEQNGVILEVIESHGSFALGSVTRKKWQSLEGIKKTGVVVSSEVFERFHSSLNSKGVTFLGDTFEDKDLRMRTFLIRDKAGNLLQFFSPIAPA